MAPRPNGTMIRLVHSDFIDRMNRSITAMLPCSPTAPNRGRIPRLRHQPLNRLQKNSLPLSVMMYLGLEPAFLIARLMNAQI